MALDEKAVEAAADGLLLLKGDVLRESAIEHCRKIIETYEAALWRPIEEGPKDGTLILCVLPGNQPFTAYFAQIKDDTGHVDCWVTGENWSNSICEYNVITPACLLFRPLPQPPEGS